MFNVFVTSRDIVYLRKLIVGIFKVYKGYLPVNFKGYGIFGTPYPSLTDKYRMNDVTQPLTEYQK